MLDAARPLVGGLLLFSLNLFGQCAPATTDIGQSPQDAVFYFQGPTKRAGLCTKPVVVFGHIVHGKLTIEVLDPCGEEGSQTFVIQDGPQSDSATDWLTAMCGLAWVENNLVGPTLNGSHPALRARPAISTAAPVFGQGSQSFILGDVNGDGNDDAIFLTTAGVNVQLQAADGSVLSTVTSAVGFTPTLVNSQLAAGDFNGDGKLDLAVSYFGNTSTNLGGAVFILLGHGDGTFAAPQQINAGQEPQSLVVADFNGDGKLDLAVANADTLNVSVLSGHGDGTFSAPVSYATGQNRIDSPRSLVAVDLNGDGLPDLAVDFTGRVSVLLNTGSSFRPAADTTVPYSPIYMGFSDLNHDGHMDLALVGLNALVFLFGKGDGTFQTPVAYATGNQPGSLTLAPTGDNYTLVSVPDAFTGVVWYTIVSPTGNTAAPRLNPVPGRPTGIAAADLTGAGQPDAVVTGTLTDVSVLVSKSGQLQPPVGYSLASATGDPGPQFPAIGDFNGDGKPDVIVANYGGSVSLLLGNGDGTLKLPVNTTINQGARSLVLGDFNRDGKLDAAVAAFGSLPGSGSDSGGVVVLLGNGNGTFQTPHTLTAVSGRPISVAAGDFNGDGKLDLAAVGIAPDESVQPVTLSIFPGNGDGTFGSAITTKLKVSAFGTTVVAAGDFNGDGKLDLAVSTDNSGIDILLGNGDGTFREVAQPPSEAGIFGLALADINQDGNPDLAVIGTDGAYLIGNGDGTFQAEQHFPSGISPVALAVFNSKGSAPGFFFADSDGVVTALRQVPQPSGPTITANVSAANLKLATIAPSSIATLFGANFATAIAQPSGSLPISLGGVTVTIVDSAGVSHAAPLFYVSPTQINYEVPAGTAAGNANVTVTSSTGLTATVKTPVASVAPGIFALTPGGLIAAIVLDVSSTGAQTFANVYQVNAANSVSPLPVDLSAGQVYLEIYGTGVRNATAANVTVTIGGVSVPVLSSGAQGQDPGLDQINVGPLPASLAGSGVANVIVNVNGQAANTTNIMFQ